MTDAHQQCLIASLASLRDDFGRDLTRLSSAERRTLDSVCNRVRTEQGRDAYLDCLGNQLVVLRNRRRPAKPAAPEAPALPPPSASEPSANPATPARPAPSLPRVWIGAAALVTLFVAAGGAFLTMKARRVKLRKCRVCGEDVQEAGDLCQKCRHEAADALRRAAAERADLERAQQDEQRRRREDEEEQRRHKARQEEDARLQHEEEARQRESARQQEDEDARRRSQPTVVAEEEFDAYDILGVPRDASKDAIHAAYLEAKSKYDLEHVAHLGSELQEHYKLKAQAVDRAYQMLKV
jgi:flagellar biosynthesis GTPase FlhF